jgi:hypothetical protein
MLALQVLVNGEVICTAGDEHPGVLWADLMLHLHLPDGPCATQMSVKAIIRIPQPPFGSRLRPFAEIERSQHVDWVPLLPLRVGDEVTFRVVDVPECDLPKERGPVER